MACSLAVLFIGALQGLGNAAPEREVAFVHVTVVPLGSEISLADQTVLVADGKIVALGPASEVELPPEAQVISGEGAYLVPGLADMHVHVWDENDLYLFVANGVTTVRNMFGAPLQLTWRKRIEAGELIGPRIRTAGPIIDGTPPVWPGSTVLTDPAGAEEIVLAQKDAGYDFLKPYARLSSECYDALARAGAEHGLVLMGHVPASVDLLHVLDAGQRTVEHLDGWAEAAQRSDSPFQGERIDFQDGYRAWATVGDDELRRVAEASREAGAWTCPTLVVTQKWAKGAQAEELLARAEMRFVSPFMRYTWGPKSPFNYLSKLSDEFVRDAHASIEHQKRAVAALKAAGAHLLAGTDMGNPFVIAGFALHEELANLVSAGLTPYEALHAATAEAALCMGEEDLWGTIAPGLSADLVLVRADPLENVAHLRERVGVMVQGRWYPEEELSAELEARARRFALDESDGETEASAEEEPQEDPEEDP